jgi:Uri superfamily endonuclease
VYQLWIELRRPVKVMVGALGVIHFTEGTYIYTGRAARGLRARVLRHVRGAERLHWHIDYLLAQRNARVVKVILASTDPDDECRVNCEAAATAGRRGARIWRLGLPQWLSGTPVEGGKLRWGHQSITVGQV